MRGTKRSFVSLTLLFACAFASIELWGDMKSCLPALEPFHAYVEHAFLNGRFIALTGIFICGCFAAFAPRAFVRTETVMRAVITCASVLGSLLFFIIPTLGTDGAVVGLSAVAVVVTGICYGWFIIVALMALSSSGKPLSQVPSLLQPG